MSTPTKLSSSHHEPQAAQASLVRKFCDTGGSINIINLTVKTPGENGRVLAKNINLTLEKGKRYVLTGASGSGKTITCKALLGQWDDCTGIIEMPRDFKIMPMSQQTYVSDSDLRSILNMKPEGQHIFRDEELTEALQKVGLDNLIQHIPGQQFRLMFADIEAALPAVLEKYQEGNNDRPSQDTLKYDIMSLISSYMDKHFEITQFLPDEQKASFKAGLRDLISPYLTDTQYEHFFNDLVKEIDTRALMPITTLLERWIPDYALKNSGRFIPRSSGSKEKLAAQMERKLRAKLTAYIRNQDTDDSHRKPGINQSQADYLSRFVAETMRQDMEKINGSALTRSFNKIVLKPLVWAFNKAGGGALDRALSSAVFHNKGARMAAKMVSGVIRFAASSVYALSWPGRAALTMLTWPLKTAGQHMRSRKSAEEFLQAATLLLQRQALKGSDITHGTRLSGGQKQKLSLALAHLHKYDLLITDEITANLDESTGDALYRELMATLPLDTTVLSIAHNAYIKKHHTHHLSLENQTIDVNEIPQNERYAPAI
ncbi:MAG: ATP-binding cassette domain-containing protein [Alphaproteobacteria bacterium]|nr:ATP-binding cassette domain-containing protein [Alphaproteobacteria bacterium]MCD8519745.1 ATP-binding cassette domain-containing protein [Alphaproteobacteria bacterium]MCD8525784.1 ATP-binding cassette domain-containing protein [Alphaproteobacteria bacterium]